MPSSVSSSLADARVDGVACQVGDLANQLHLRRLAGLERGNGQEYGLGSARVVGGVQRSVAVNLEVRPRSTVEPSSASLNITTTLVLLALFGSDLGLVATRSSRVPEHTGLCGFQNGIGVVHTHDERLASCHLPSALSSSVPNLSSSPSRATVDLVVNSPSSLPWSAQVSMPDSLMKPLVITLPSSSRQRHTHAHGLWSDVSWSDTATLPALSSATTHQAMVASASVSSASGIRTWALKPPVTSLSLPSSSTLTECGSAFIRFVVRALDGHSRIIALQCGKPRRPWTRPRRSRCR